ncbi:MAG: hypothetical protein ACTSPV_16640 [Candidatus Hodarchaeales archaeon]
MPTVKTNPQPLGMPVSEFEEQKEVKTFVEALGVPTTEEGSYMAYGSEIMGIRRKHSGSIAIAEENIAQAKWLARGLNNTFMARLRAEL